jgi:hypothetical protein
MHTLHLREETLFFGLSFPISSRYQQTNRLNTELNLQSLFVLHVHSCTHWLRPRTASLRIWAYSIYEGAIGQPR